MRVTSIPIPRDLRQPDRGRSRARSRGAFLAIVPSLLATTLPVGAQPPAPYRPPTIALVQPSANGTVPRDKPIVVFRFAPGESDDPIDARSFAVTVDGTDRSARFQVTASEAWGSLAGSAASDSLLAPGPHAVIARVCSIRGACAMTGVTVTVDPNTMAGGNAPVSPEGTGKPASSRAQLIVRVLDVIRKLLVP